MATFEDPSTDNAKLKGGINDGSYDTEETYINNAYQKGSLGAPERLTTSGDMRESKTARQEALDNGLPERITGTPLGCTCRVAYLNAVGPVVDGAIEVDYTCDSGWHNFVLFEVRQYANEGERGLKIDKYGNLVESVGFTAGELGEM